MGMFSVAVRYALALAFSLGAMHFNGASARAEKCSPPAANDIGRFSSSPSFPGAPPVAVGSIPDKRIGRDFSFVRFSVRSYFMETSGSALSYSAVSSKPGVARAEEMCGSMLKISAVSEGTATITVTASANGGSATQTVSVTVANNASFVPSTPNNGAPVPEGAISDTTFTQKTSPISFFVSPYFSDPDPEDALIYSVLSSNTGAVMASITDSTLTLTAASKGAATVTVTATDPSSADATQVFRATIANSPPESEGAIPDTTVAVGDSLVFHVSPYFKDPDPEDALTYGASSSATSVATASITDSTLTITPVSAGTGTVTVTATDPPGASAALQFAVTVSDITFTVKITGPDSIASGVENTWMAQASEGTSPYTYSWDYATGCVDSEHSPADDSCVWQWTSAGTGSTLTQTITTADTLAGVRVTATDSTTPTALSAMDSLVVSVNHAPDTVGTIAARTIVLGRPDVSFSVAEFFSDPDNDELIYEAESSSDDTVGVSISGSMLTLAAKLVNTVPDTVTVTATDPSGLMSPVQEFAVTVRSGTLTAEITGDNLMSIVSGTEYTWGSTVTGGAPPYTYSWSYATRCIDEDLIRAEPCVWQWTGAGSESSYTKTITTTVRSVRLRLIVSDSSIPAVSVTKNLSLRVTQPVATGPTPTGTISARTLTAGGSSSSFSVSSYFRKPNEDDVLTYSASSSNTNRVTASMSGATLTISPVAAGSATITVTATLNGRSAKQSFSVTVKSAPTPSPPQTPANGSPVAVGTISNRTLTLVTSPSASFGVASSFSDPDGDALTYSASSSNTGVVSTSISGSTLTITAASQGTATITVTATDPGNLSATQQFTVTVPNRSPAAAGTISNRTLTLVTSPSASFGVASSFSDPDGDALTYSASSSNTGVVSTSMSGSTLTITAASQGTATVTVTARDPGNLSATQQFTVTVPNRSPAVSSDIPDQALTAGGPAVTFNLDSYFSDPDGDDLNYRVSLALTSIATARISGSTLTITPVSAGNATMNVFAEDRTRSVSQSVAVTVSTAAGLSASISGPSSITTYGSKTWTASASGGSSPYTYSWRYRRPCSEEEGPSGTAAPSCTEWASGGTASSLTLTLSDSTTIELTVTDDDDDSVTATLAVSVSYPDP